MKGEAARRLVRLYPRAWRDRYGEEFLALLEERPESVGDLFDVAFGALDAWLRPQVAAERRTVVVERMRGSVLLVLWAWVGLVVAGIGFEKMTEYGDFVRAARDSVLVGVAFYAVVIGAVLALAAVVVGGAPIAFEAVRRDRTKRLDAEKGGRFYGRLDTGHVGMFGHSLGGATSLSACASDESCRAAANLDGNSYGAESLLRDGSPKPFCASGATRRPPVATGSAGRETARRARSTNARREAPTTSPWRAPATSTSPTTPRCSRPY